MLEPRHWPDLDVHAPPFSRNPSSWRQRVPICALAGVGFLVSCYLTLYQWQLVDTVWDPVFGDGSVKVLESEVSHSLGRWFGIPDAALGAIAYLGDLVFGLAGSTRRWQYRPWLVLIFGFDVIPLGIVSIVLVGMQGFAVGAWCFLCLVTAAVSVALILIAYDEVWAALKYLWRVWRRGGARPAWAAFRGVPSDVAARVALEGGH